MTDRSSFTTAMAELVELGASKGNILSKEDIKTFLGDMVSGQEQMEAVYTYLRENNIEIEGTKNSFKPSYFESEQELEFIKMYKDEMSGIKPATLEEIEELTDRLTLGDMDVVSRIVEAHLLMAEKIASEYRGRSVEYGDLIQEANVAMMLAVSDYSQSFGLIGEYIDKRIRQALDELVNTEIHEERVGQHLADRLNHLDDVTKKLSNELDHIPSIEEIAREMGISEEEVSDLITKSIETVSLKSGVGENEGSEADDFNAESGLFDDEDDKNADGRTGLSWDEI